MIDLHGLALELMAKIEADFAAAFVPLPDRRYVTVGEVAIDCEQFVVQVVNMHSGLPGLPTDLRTKLPRTQAMALAVWIIRCVPTLKNDGRPPSDDELNQSAIEILQDAELVFTASMSRAWQDACQDATGATLDFYGPEGGFGGTITRVEVQI